MAPSSKTATSRSAAEAIHQAMQDNPDIAALSHQVIIGSDARRPAHPAGRPGRPADVPARHQRADALHEKAPGRDRQGSSTACPTASRSAATPTPSRVTVYDSATNWELVRRPGQCSPRRPAPARALATDRIYEVAGQGRLGAAAAGRSQCLAPTAGLSILLMREAPPVPPGHKL